MFPFIAFLTIIFVYTVECNNIFTDATNKPVVFSADNDNSDLIHLLNRNLERTNGGRKIHSNNNNNNNNNYYDSSSFAVAAAPPSSVLSSLSPVDYQQALPPIETGNLQENSNDDQQHHHHHHHFQQQKQQQQQQQQQRQLLKVNKPSKLRLYLLADLATRTPDMKSVTDCESTADLRISTRGCSCTNYSCVRYLKNLKKPRILDRSCEDVCCGGKQRIKGGKSLNLRNIRNSDDTENQEREDNKTEDTSKVARCGELMKRPETNETVLPWTISIENVENKFGKCTANLLNSRIVITSLNCLQGDIVISRKSNDGEHEKEVKVIKEILTSDLLEDSVIILVSDPFQLPGRGPCLLQDIFRQGKNESTSRSCFIGLENGTSIPVTVNNDDNDECNLENMNDKTLKPVCVKNTWENVDVLPGAPLYCSWNSDFPNNVQIVGILTHEDNGFYFFDNVSNLLTVIKRNADSLTA